eukprot:superscaffoldBa00003030_g15929
MKRLTGTRSNGSPCQDTGPEEVSPSASPDPSTHMNNAGELPVVIVVAGGPAWAGSRWACVHSGAILMPTIKTTIPPELRIWQITPHGTP